jgi:hypothetical protein
MVEEKVAQFLVMRRILEQAGISGNAHYPIRE